MTISTFGSTKRKHNISVGTVEQSNNRKCFVGFLYETPNRNPSHCGRRATCWVRSRQRRGGYFKPGLCHYIRLARRQTHAWLALNGRTKGRTPIPIIQSLLGSPQVFWKWRLGLITSAKMCILVYSAIARCNQMKDDKTTQTSFMKWPHAAGL